MTRMTNIRFAAASAALLGVAGGLVGCAGDGAVSGEAVETEVTAEAVTTVATTTMATTTLATTQAVDDTSVTEAALPGDVIADLVFLREEERLAGDVYDALGDLWGVQIFDNIGESEDRHTDAVLQLLETYGIDDPAADLPAGQYDDPVLQALYDDLIAQGTVSLVDALHVGATIEDLDIVDLRERASGIDDIDAVLASLEQGSMNHLAAFVGQLERRGEGYVAQYLTQEEVDAIVAG